MRKSTPEEMVKRAQSYANAAKYAGKMLAHLDEAGCFCPSVALFGDGSGHFVVSHGSQPTAGKVFERYLGKVPYKSPSRERQPSVEYAIDLDTFDTYRDVCHACDRPL